MSGKIKRGLCWALTALQVDLSTEHKVEKEKDENVRPIVSDQNNNNGEGCDENVRPLYSRRDIADHCSSQSCWMVINNKVYDVTRFLRMHPGGDDIMLEYGGHDATSAFIDKGHSVDAYEMLSEYCIGEVTKVDWFPEKNFT